MFLNGEEVLKIFSCLDLETDRVQRCVLLSLAGHLRTQKISERLLENWTKIMGQTDRQTDTTYQHTWQNYFPTSQTISQTDLNVISSPLARVKMAIHKYLPLLVFGVYIQ